MVIGGANFGTLQLITCLRTLLTWKWLHIIQFLASWQPTSHIAVMLGISTSWRWEFYRKRKRKRRCSLSQCCIK